MAITTRKLTGPIETPEHEVVETGLLRVHLLYPIAEDDTLIVPFKIEYNIEDGDLPESAKLATPGSYEFRIYDYTEERVWSFQVAVWSNSGSSISIAELWLLSRLGQDDPTNVNLENVDASILGSDGATDGYVLTADGDGGTDWLPVGALTPGDMTKAVYDTNDDGRVDAADHATVAALSDNATLFAGLASSAYQLALQDAVTQGAILTWDIGSTSYIPNENFLVDADGNILAGGIRLIGALYGNVYVMSIVYYLIDEETHVLVTKEDDVELRLPDPTAHDGRIIEIKKASSDGFTVSVTSAGGGLIEGGAAYDLIYQYEAITVVSADGEWFIF